MISRILSLGKLYLILGERERKLCSGQQYNARLPPRASYEWAASQQETSQNGKRCNRLAYGLTLSMRRHNSLSNMELEQTVDAVA